ncbi:DUF6063 family protein [Ureibacillus thermosphaericus]|jgi:hypothetical protein|uniref:DUF6063 family protein n=1 Tax=Ureibacillus thermosphaericus TaxID=51173 RepID=UPI00031C7DA7|nr:DUF6063 family protein [Ureibacillus thermosphaericus]
MNYSEQTVLQAFRLYTKLAKDGVLGKEAVQIYNADEDVRALLELFSQEVHCAIIKTSEELFLVPEPKLSPFHVSNEWIKRKYLRSGATNADMYLLYFCILVLFGSFYDSYQSPHPTRQFIGMDDWIRLIQERIDHLKSHDEEQLKASEKEFSYNWSAIIEKWDDMDDIKETAKRQSGNTISRMSFLHMVAKFLNDQQLIREIGNNEITLTEKAMTIIQRFFMAVEYNKGIFEFLYGFDKEGQHAGHQ